MRTRNTLIRVVITICLLFFIGVPAVAAEDYGVQPAYGIAPEPLQDTSVSITFWDLSLREMVLILALSFFPTLVFPIEFFFTVKLFIYLGYRKVSQNAIIYNQNRLNILEMVCANPGLNFPTLSRMTGINRGTLNYHLFVLQLKKKITLITCRGSVRYFENSGRYSDLEKILLGYMQNETSRQILYTLLISPNVSQSQIAEMLGVSGPSVSWHFQRFYRDGIVNRQKQGRYIKYWLKDETLSLVSKYHKFLADTI